MDPTLSAGLTLFGIKDVPMNNVQKAIFDYNRVWIRTMGTGNLNACRAATHIYNFPHEVDRLLEGVRYVAQNPQKFMTPTAAALYAPDVEAMMG
jgi:selenocysteine lyase/cysteine desulfurase